MLSRKQDTFISLCSNKNYLERKGRKYIGTGDEGGVHGILPAGHDVEFVIRNTL